MTEGDFQFSHERLDAWRKAMRLVTECYRLANRLPDYERYGLASQIRRAAISIPANIAEGCGRIGLRDRLRFFVIARGSICELRTLLEASRLLDYATAEELCVANQLTQEVGQLVSGLRRRLLRTKELN